MSAKYVKANDDDEEVKNNKHEDVKNSKHDEVNVVKLTRWQKRLRFVYNKANGDCCGRSRRSWLYLVIYFLSFYTVLVILFIISIHIFLSGVINPKVPKRTGENSVLQFIPGMNVYPKLSIESALIIASNNKSSDFYKKYLLSIEKFFNKSFLIPEFSRDAVNCSDNTTPRNISQFCRINKSELGPCANPKEELDSNRLCFYIRINKIYGWLPDVKNKRLSNDTFVHCEGQNTGDVNNLGNPVYYPKFDSNNASSYGVISNIFYPFINQINYSSPIVAVQFPDMTKNIAILTQCTLRNLKKVSKPVKFELMLTTVK